MGKGGSTTSTVEIPEYIEQAAKRNLNKAESISQIGYTPYYGPDVAAFTPFQQSAFQNTADVASAFGMNVPLTQSNIMGGMDAPTTYANGVRGYSSAPMAEESLASLAASRPGQKDFIDSFFIDPFTGTAGNNVLPPVDYTNLPFLPALTGSTPASTPVAGGGGVTPPPTPPVVTPAPVVPASFVGGTTSPVGPAKGSNPANPVVVNVGSPPVVPGAVPPVIPPVGPSFIGPPVVTPVVPTPAGSGVPGEVAGGPNFTVYGGTPNVAGAAIDAANEAYGAAITDGTATPEGNPAFNAGVAAANANTPVTFSTPSGESVTKPASELTSSDIKGATAAGIAKVTAALASGDKAGAEALAAEVGAKQNELAALSMLSVGISDVGGGSNQDNTIGFGNVPASSLISTPASGITDTSTAGGFETAINDIGQAIVGNTVGLIAPSYAAGGVNNPGQNPTVAEMVAAAPSGMQYDASTGGYFRPEAIAAPAPAAPKGKKFVGLAPPTSSRPKMRGETKSSCVIATHAVESGMFSTSTKREAVVWCMNVLHGKWWGEAIRRGYRHLGRSKIKQGKAAQHYQEFRDYIAFANGKKRTIKGALHFAARTAQFFVVGMIKRDI